ncbi:hypothetical protein Taro_020600, partial [Colocasia esculenta]|nr:hypothetical protein [Colocasia esculenta]
RVWWSGAYSGIPLQSDTLTPVFELYIRLRERRQRAVPCVCRYVVLIGLHYSLACACGAAVGPFIRDCETEMYGGTVVFVVLWWYLMEVGVVLIGLHCSLACACGVAVGPFIRDCETEMYGGTVVFVVLWWYLMEVGGEVELCSVEVML